MDDLKRVFAELMATDFTPTIHKRAYPAISPSRPELSQAGKSVLITGGGTNIGKAIAEHFVLAQAENVIIVGRRPEILQAAAADLEQKGQQQKSPSKVLVLTADVSDKSAIESLFQELARDGIEIDVLALNAAKFSDGKPLLEAGMDAVWSEIEVNLKGPMYLTEQFMKQNGDKQKVSGEVSKHCRFPDLKLDSS